MTEEMTDKKPLSERITETDVTKEWIAEILELETEKARFKGALGMIAIAFAPDDMVINVDNPMQNAETICEHITANQKEAEQRARDMHRRAQKAEAEAAKIPDRMEWQNDEIQRLRDRARAIPVSEGLPTDTGYYSFFTDFPSHLVGYVDYHKLEGWSVELTRHHAERRIWNLADFTNMAGVTHYSTIDDAPPETEEHECSCGDIFDSKPALKLHREMVHDDKPETEET